MCPDKKYFVQADGRGINPKASIWAQGLKPFSLVLPRISKPLNIWQVFQKGKNFIFFLCNTDSIFHFEVIRIVYQNFYIKENTIIKLSGKIRLIQVHQNLKLLWSKNFNEIKILNLDLKSEGTFLCQLCWAEQILRIHT